LPTFAAPRLQHLASSPKLRGESRCGFRHLPNLNIFETSSSEVGK